MYFENKITSTEANQRFTQMLRDTDICGVTVITKSGKPAYVLMTYTEFEKREGDLEMRNIIEKAKGQNGVWVMARDVNAEVFLGSAAEDQIYGALKVKICEDKTIDLIEFDKGMPILKTFHSDRVKIEETSEGLQIKTYASPFNMLEYEEEVYKNEERYKEQFLAYGCLTEDEMETYSNISRGALPEVNLMRCS